MRFAIPAAVLFALLSSSVCRADLLFDTFDTPQSVGAANDKTILMDGVGETQWMKRSLRSTVNSGFTSFSVEADSSLTLSGFASSGFVNSVSLTYDFVAGEFDPTNSPYQFSGISDQVFYFADTGTTPGTLLDGGVLGLDVVWDFTIVRDGGADNTVASAILTDVADRTWSGSGDDLVMALSGDTLGLVDAIEFTFSWGAVPGLGAQPALGTVQFSNANGLAATPEPASLALCGLGLFGVAGMVVQRRRRTKKEK